MMMVTLHEPDFRSLEVTVLQTADRGIILLISCPHYIQRPTNCQLAIWCSSTESNCRLILTMDSLYHLTTRALVPPLWFEQRELLLLRESTLPICPWGHIEFVSSCPSIIATIYPIKQVRTAWGTSLGLCPVSHHYRPLQFPAGWELNPLTFYYTTPSKNIDSSVILLADTYKTWSEWQESNLHYKVPNLGDYHYHTLRNTLVQPRGIEPLSLVLQTSAMTTSAKVALGRSTGIEPVTAESQPAVLPLN